MEPVYANDWSIPQMQVYRRLKPGEILVSCRHGQEEPVTETVSFGRPREAFEALRRLAATYEYLHLCFPVRLGSVTFLGETGLSRDDLARALAAIAARTPPAKLTPAEVDATVAQAKPLLADLNTRVVELAGTCAELHRAVEGETFASASGKADDMTAFAGGVATVADQLQELLWSIRGTR